MGYLDKVKEMELKKDENSEENYFFDLGFDPLLKRASDHRKLTLNNSNIENSGSF